MFILGMAFRKRLSGDHTWKLKAAALPESQAGASLAVRNMWEKPETGWEILELHKGKDEVGTWLRFGRQ